MPRRKGKGKTGAKPSPTAASLPAAEGTSPAPAFKVPSELAGIDPDALRRFREDAVRETEGNLASERAAAAEAAIAFLEGRDSTDPAPAGSAAAASSGPAAPVAAGAELHPRAPGAAAGSDTEAPGLPEAAPAPRSREERLAAEAAASSDIASLIDADDVIEAVRLAGLGSTPLQERAARRVRGLTKSTRAEAAAASAPPAKAAAAPAAPSAAPAGAFAPVDVVLRGLRPVASASHVPLDALSGALALLDAVSLTRCRRVCRRWRTASDNERLWRRHCRRTCRINTDPDLPARVRASARALGSWRLAFPRIPQVHSTGIYVMRGGYFRQPYRDAWHTPPPFLHCVFHRVLALRPDGSLLYGNIPGSVAEAVRRIRRVSQFAASTKATPAAVEGAARAEAEEAEAAAVAAAGGKRRRRRGGDAVADIARAQAAAAISSGRFCLDGNTVRAEVWAVKGRILRWTLRLSNIPEEERTARGMPARSAVRAGGGGGAAAAATKAAGLEAAAAAAATVGDGAGSASKGPSFEGMCDRLEVDDAVMAFVEGSTAEDAMRAALAADETESSSEDEDEAPGRARVSSVARQRGFRWRDAADGLRLVPVESLRGKNFEFLPVDGL